MSEEFRDITGYEGLYQVSNYGRVFSLVRGIFRAPRFDRYGYLRTTLYKNWGSKTLTIHRLVAEAFLGIKLSKYYQVNHKDGDKTNNYASNLEYVLPIDNSRHAIRLGLSTPKQYSRKLTDEQEREIVEQYIPGVNSQDSIAYQYGVSNQTISNVFARNKL